MKKHDKKELHIKSQEELKKLLKDATEQLVSLQSANKQNMLKQTSSLTTKRKEIAVLKTIMNMKAKEAIKNG